MDAQPQPEPKPEEAAPVSPQAQSETRASDSKSDRRSSEAYTAMPNLAVRKKRWWPLALALALAAGAAGIGLRHHPVPAMISPAVVQSYEVLAFSQKDFDAATTASAQAVLSRDKTTHELAVLAEQIRTAPSTPSPLPAPTVAQQAMQELAVAPQTMRDDVSAGKVGFYTFHLAELVDEGGDVYDIAVDGAPLLRITTSPQLKSITLPMDVSKPHTVTQTLVFARDRTFYAKSNGPGGPPPAQPQSRASLTIQSSAGEARSHLSSPGESQVWSTQFRGSP